MKLSVFPNKKFQIILTDKNFINSGGEGSVYGKDDIIYKIYEDQTRAISIRKINELSLLTKQNIVHPIDPLFDNKSILIGYTMKWIKDTEVLCKLFTNSFQQSKNITLTQIIELVSNFQETIEYIHNNKCLVVDINEFNFLVDKGTYKIPYFIDVDSYQTPSYPATAIMPTIKDYHQTSFNIKSDWFSFGIIAFQLFVGMHPYKGSHPKYSKAQLIDRMKGNVSVFNKHVSLPNNIRSIDHIPSEYKTWFYNIFEKGERLPPPTVSPLQQIYAPVKHKSFILQSSFNIDLYKSIKETIVTYYNSHGTDIIFTNKKLYCDSIVFDLPEPYNKKRMTAINFDGTTYFVYVNKSNKLHIIDVKSGEMITTQISAKGILNIENDLYSIYDDKFQHLKILELNKKLVVGIDASWDILPNSTYQFTNIIYSNILSSCYVYIPINDKNAGCSILHIKELDKKKIVDIRREKNIAIIVYFESGKYNEMTIQFNSSYETYNIDCIDVDINYSGINFVVTNKDVLIKIDTDNEMLLMSTKDMTQKKRIKNNSLSFDMNLSVDNQIVRYFIDNEVYNISIK